MRTVTPRPPSITMNLVKGESSLRHIAIQLIVVAVLVLAIMAGHYSTASADTGSAQTQIQTAIDDSIDSGISTGQDCSEDCPIEDNSIGNQDPVLDSISAPQCLLPGIPC